MLRRTFPVLLLVCLVTGALWAVGNPFVGDWKLDPSKSTIVEEMKVATVAGNKYAFNFGGGNDENIVADGTDQPGNDGTTLSVTVEAPDSWKVVRKKDGRVLVTGLWKLSQDGSTLTDDFTGFASDGSATNVKYSFHRTAGKSGFVGTWDSTSQDMSLVYVLQVRPYEGDGLSFIYRSDDLTKNVKFDGKDYPNVGPNVPVGLTSSARQVDANTLELNDKFKGQTAATQQIKLSADRKTLTVTLSATRVLVFERQ